MLNQCDQKRSSVVAGFVRAVDSFAQRTALEVDGCAYTYERLGKMANNITVAIKTYELGLNPLAAIFAYRSETAYAGILGILLSGKGYVPLNPEFPIDRTYRMLNLSKTNVVIVGKECVDQLPALLSQVKKTLTIITPDTPQRDDLLEQYPIHHYVFSGDMPDRQAPIKEPEVDPESAAYLLFTSGSTGIPKGVAVSHKNVCSYVEYICDRYDVNEADRFSQTFDTTFDLSVHDMFVSWERGACLCCVPKKYVMMPAKFIKEMNLTMWFSVPSVAMFMSKMRMLVPGSFPSLRYSLFCGEPFSAALAEQWQKAAADSTVENLYGPTEATIAISYYTWHNQSPEACVNGVVPIGWIFQGQKCCLVDAQFNVVEEGQPGELCLCGSQVTTGYLNNPEKTAQQYIHIPAMGDGLWYRTGDLARQDKKGCLYYLGRIDNQVKILGHRVELQEIDHALREASGIEMAVSVAWPIRDGSAAGVVGFIGAGNNVEESVVLAHCKKGLPEYMVPKNIYFLDNIPLNSNGKLDRLKLTQMLDQGVLA